MNNIQKIKKYIVPTISTILIVTGIFFIGSYIKTVTLAPKPIPPPIEKPVEPSPQPPSPQPSTPEEPKFIPYPTDKLFITVQRDTYKDGDMSLSIPHLKLKNLPVIDGDDAAALAKGVGLMQYSQTPDAGNSNVSIVAHRDICGAEFYYIDTLTEGDLFYLTYEGKQYEYIYEKTQIVEKDDWSPIYCSDNAKLTLMSCDPIGTTLHRIIVTASLREVSEIVVDNLQELRNIETSAANVKPEGKVITDEKST